MATLRIREYAWLGAGGPLGAQQMAQVPLEPGLDQPNLTFTTSQASAAFQASTTIIGIVADAAFHYVVGANPTATTAALWVPANTLIFLGVQPGHKIAAIAA